jgi:hypothetical protein
MSTQNIYPKSCVYNCNTQLYWNTLENEYWEVLPSRKHLANRLSHNNNDSYL